jgi:predicted RNase H-like HicB family nuclease
MVYALYLESGPKRRKTMVHVLDLLGCITQGPTTEAALEATPDAIRAYLRFLRQHDESVAPDASFTTVVAEHITQGNWLGHGDPTPGFSVDFQLLSSADLAVYLRRLNWLRAGVLALIRDLSPEQLVAEPGDGSRSLFRIVEHMAESGCVYLRYLALMLDPID